MKYPNEKKTIAGRLKELRVKLNIKGKDFAGRLKISGLSLSELESGKYYPNFELISNLAKEYNVNLDWLFFGEGNMFIEPGKYFDVKRLSEFAGNADMGKFFRYFEKSSIVRYSVLIYFATELVKKKEVIEEEIEISGKKEKEG